jgi:predicted Zn-ribbon and HTH transcriptional regulator
MPELIAKYGSKAAFVLVVLLVIYVARRMMAAPKVDPHHSQVQCNNCGWSGSVSKYKPRCPKCAQAITS